MRGENGAHLPSFHSPSTKVSSPSSTYLSRVSPRPSTVFLALSSSSNRPTDYAKRFRAREEGRGSRHKAYLLFFSKVARRIERSRSRGIHGRMRVCAVVSSSLNHSLLFIIAILCTWRYHVLHTIFFSFVFLATLSIVVVSADKTADS